MSDQSMAAAPYQVQGGRIVNPEGCEVNVALHCNLSCRACTHMSPVAPKAFLQVETLRRDLSALAPVYRSAFIKLLGGEPLLHPDLPAVLDVVRESGISDWVTVCTNGLLLGRVGDAFWSRVDEVEISLYPGRAPASGVLDRAVEQARAHGVRLQAAVRSHFRESHSEVPRVDEHLTSEVFQTCKSVHLWRCHTVHEGHFFRCPQSAFLPMVLGPEEDLLADAICLAPAGDLFDRLLAHLSSAEALRACRRCLGSVGRLVPHAQARHDEWHAPHAAPSEQLIDQDYLRLLQIDPSADEGCVDRQDVLVEGRC